MKKIMTLAVLGVLLTAATGCQKNCDEWFELDGKNCIELRTKYYGTYTGTATSIGQTVNAQTQFSIYDGDVQRMRFLLDGPQPYVVLSSETAFSIPLQNVYMQGATWQIEGSGSFNGNQVNFNYIATYSGQSYTVNFTGTK